jgi:RNA:NAD 2'-phosphotransferase (TPT1/KptA family)
VESAAHVHLSGDEAASSAVAARRPRSVDLAVDARRMVVKPGYLRETR